MTPEQKADAIRATCDEFAEFMVGVLATGDIPNISEGSERLARLEQAQVVAGELIVTREMIEGTLSQTEEVIVARSFVEAAESETAAHQEAIARIAGLETTISTLETERDETRTNLTRVQAGHQAAVERVRDLARQPT